MKSHTLYIVCTVTSPFYPHPDYSFRPAYPGSSKQKKIFFEFTLVGPYRGKHFPFGLENSPWLSASVNNFKTSDIPAKK
jgi:hypothetical protein